MKTEIVPKKVQYNKLCIFTHRHFVFSIRFITPTRIANAGNIVGDYITIALTGVGIILSIITMTKRTEKKGIAILSLILSASFLYFGS